METLQILGAALGLATLAGINLYLTVFLAGLAIRFDWITLSAQYQQLEILAHPAIIAVAGIMYFIEFLADKVPWLDSAWDSVHTFIRPVGGTLLALQTLGESNPAFDVIVAMLACGMSLATHSLKAGVRFVVNGSPEPVSNIAVSLAEDAGVVGGLWLLWANPVLALVIFVLALVAAFWFAPRLFRAAKTRLWLAWRKLSAPSSTPRPAPRLLDRLPADADILLHSAASGASHLAWAAFCLVGQWKGVSSYRRAWIAVTADQPQTLYLLAPSRWGKGLVRELSLVGYKVSREPKFLSENLVLYNPATKEKRLLIFDRASISTVDAIVAQIESLPECPDGSPAPLEEEPALVAG